MLYSKLTVSVSGYLHSLILFYLPCLVSVNDLRILGEDKMAIDCERSVLSHNLTLWLLHTLANERLVFLVVCIHLFCFISRVEWV